VPANLIEQSGSWLRMVGAKMIIKSDGSIVETTGTLNAFRIDGRCRPSKEDYT
jgi:hypothetical protein